MPDYIRMGLILTVICAFATAFLAGTDALTKDRIAEAKREEMLRTLTHVLPTGFDNEPDRDTVTLSDGRLNRKASPVIFYRAAKKSDYIGVAFMVTAADGYAGEIGIMMSVLANGTIQSVQVVAHKETPGLGDRIIDSVWTGSFTGKSLTNAKWAVKKDGGVFDQFAGATISPRAVVNAVKRGLEFFTENKSQIFARRGL